jgi:hypothetical protein
MPMPGSKTLAEDRLRMALTHLLERIGLTHDLRQHVGDDRLAWLAYNGDVEKVINGYTTHVCTEECEGIPF